MQKPKSPELEDVQFWERMDFLIGDERPYPWSERVGLNRSAFQSARTRGKKPLPKTVKLWAEKIGCSYEWLQNGVGQPWPEQAFESKAVVLIEKLDTTTTASINDQINQELLLQCFDSTDGALYSTYRVMEADDKADFILRFYKALANEDGVDLTIDEDRFILAVFTIEIALYYTRRIMSPSNKVELISDIYNKYAKNPEMQKQTLNEYKEYRERK